MLLISLQIWVFPEKCAILKGALDVLTAGEGVVRALDAGNVAFSFLTWLGGLEVACLSLRTASTVATDCTCDATDAV
jgi:hypothetical protein